MDWIRRYVDGGKMYIESLDYVLEVSVIFYFSHFRLMVNATFSSLILAVVLSMYLS